MADFTPSPIRFRVWDGERMHHPDDSFFDSPEWAHKIWSDGTPAEVFPDGKIFIPMLSTGLHDAEGREVFDGDIVVAPHDFGPGGWHEREFTVSANPGLDFGWHYWDMEKARVVGNAFEGLHASA